MTATPWGFRDILPEEAQAREEIAYTVKGCFREHHYLPVETPLLEDKGSLEEGGRIADTPFKLFDDDGRLLVVRPDNTLPIVRLVSTRMRAADLPLRLRYEAPVVRECQRNAGGSRQFTQLGFELIGVGDTAGDVEIVSLVAEAVRKLALPDARIIAGSVRPFKELLAACEDRELAAEALRCVHANDFVGLDARVAASTESDAVKAAISELPRLHGGAEVLDRVDALLEAAGIAAPPTRELRALVEGLIATRCWSRLTRRVRPAIPATVPASLRNSRRAGARPGAWPTRKD
ncbi:ATP phosphoribosyltransferase regulatory subunit [Collinsella sp. LCP21S3_A3]|uniref:ATP phosphoribosyltransferase regulatory subunit n=1 Tax=unclassified Collinsella TaxID=2637548 RepID=UPI003F8FA44A